MIVWERLSGTNPQQMKGDEMAEGTCKTCKWWSESEWKPHQEGWRQCDVAEAEGYHQYANKTIPLPLMMCVDGESYAAKLFTSPDFGCIHHEAKATADGEG